MTAKTLIQALATSLCLLLAMPSPGVAGEAPFEPLPIGAKARLGQGTIRTVMFSPDGSRLAIASSVGIWLYDTQTYEAVSLLADNTDGGNVLAFSPDGRTLANGNGNGTVHLWDTVTGILRHTLEGHEGWITRVEFSPDGRVLVSASKEVSTSKDDSIRLWDTATGTLLILLNPESNRSVSMEFSPDGRTLASGGWDGTVRLWDTATGTLRQTLKGHTGRVWSIKFSPDGRTLASGGEDYTARLWDVATGTLRHTLEGHTNEVAHVAFSPDGRILASASWDNTARLWNTVTGTLHDTLEGFKGSKGLEFSLDGRTLKTHFGGHYDRKNCGTWPQALCGSKPIRTPKG